MIQLGSRQVTCCWSDHLTFKCAQTHRLQELDLLPGLSSLTPGLPV